MVLQIFGEAGQTVKIARHELGYGRSAGGCANVTFTDVSGADGHETIPNTALSGPLDLQNVTFTAVSRALRPDGWAAQPSRGLKVTCYMAGAGRRGRLPGGLAGWLAGGLGLPGSGELPRAGPEGELLRGATQGSYSGKLLREASQGS